MRARGALICCSFSMLTTLPIAVQEWNVAKAQERKLMQQCETKNSARSLSPPPLPDCLLALASTLTRGR